MEALAAKTDGLSTTDRMQLGFALGKVYADLKDNRRSFAHLREANALKRATVSYDEKGALGFFDRIDSSGRDGVTIGVFAQGSLSFLQLKRSVDLRSIMPDLYEMQLTLDVVILHRLMLEKCLGIAEEAIKKESYITYVRERDRAIGIGDAIAGVDQLHGASVEG